MIGMEIIINFESMKKIVRHCDALFFVVGKIVSGIRHKSEGSFGDYVISWGIGSEGRSCRIRSNKLRG